MSGRKLISEDSICLDLKARTKAAIIAELVDLLIAAGKITDREAALHCVTERETKMSTGMQHGIAIPHGKTNTVTKVHAVLAVKRGGVDFGSLDGEPSRIFILTISPQAATGPHIQFLAEISHLLSNRETRHVILNASTRAEIAQALKTS